MAANVDDWDSSYGTYLHSFIVTIQVTNIIIQEIVLLSYYHVISKAYFVGPVQFDHSEIWMPDHVLGNKVNFSLINYIKKSGSSFDSYWIFLGFKKNRLCVTI